MKTIKFCVSLFLAYWMLGHVSVNAQSGQLDPSFGLGGWVHTDLGGKEQAGTTDIQADGKILVGGRIAIQTSEYDFLLLRYLENGQLDSSFGNKGYLIWDFGNKQENLEFVRVLPGGKILAGGFSGVNPNTNGILIQLLPDGNPDPDFGTDGIVFFKCGKSTGPIVAQIDAQENIVVSGVCVVDSFDIDWFVARFLPDGKPDLSFNNIGWTYHNFLTREDIPFDLLIEPGGKILVTGCAGVYPKANYAFLRLNSDGSRDLSFGNNGELQTDFAGNHDIGYTTAITSDGKYLTAGTVRDDVTNYDFSLAKYFPNGELDPGFGNGGKMTYDFNGPVDYGLYMIKQPDHKYLVCGENNVLTHNKFVVVRYLENGQIDSSFGDMGIAGFDAVNILTDHTPHFAMQKDGKIVMVANYKDGQNVNVLVIRWTNEIIVHNEDQKRPKQRPVQLLNNPVQNEIQLEHQFPLSNQALFMDLIDINGNVLGQYVNSVQNSNIILRNKQIELLPSGIYFLKWKHGLLSGSLSVVKL